MEKNKKGINKYGFNLFFKLLPMFMSYVIVSNTIDQLMGLFWTIFSSLFLIAFTILVYTTCIITDDEEIRFSSFWGKRSIIIKWENVKQLTGSNLFGHMIFYMPERNMENTLLLSGLNGRFRKEIERRMANRNSRINITDQ